MNKEKEVVTAYIKPSLKAEVKIKLATEKISMSSLIEQLLMRYVDG